jgi:two-component system catabolic regulation response regulator CreB
VDLILLDIGLPDVNGLDLCREIRKSHATPIIFLTARSAEIDRVVGLEIGGDDYVSKPFSPKELSARVRAVLRRTRGSQAPPPPPAPAPTAFEVDGSRRQVSYAGRPVELSRYEYEILTTFIRRPGHVFSREQLMGLVWEQPGTSLERSVDAHIKNIRAKLKAIRPDRDPIVTHRGVGYSLKEGA